MDLSASNFPIKGIFIPFIGDITQKNILNNYYTCDQTLNLQNEVILNPMHPPWCPDAVPWHSGLPCAPVLWDQTVDTRGFQNRFGRCDCCERPSPFSPKGNRNAGGRGAFQASLKRHWLGACRGFRQWCDPSLSRFAVATSAPEDWPLGLQTRQTPERAATGPVPPPVEFCPQTGR